jgi:Holliday junction resolvase
MNASKDKGRRLENLVANTLNENGFPAERTPLSGSFGKNYSEDVIIGTRDNIPRTIERKNRQGFSDKIWTARGTNDYLSIKENVRDLKL